MACTVNANVITVPIAWCSVHNLLVKQIKCCRIRCTTIQATSFVLSDSSVFGNPAGFTRNAMNANVFAIVFRTLEFAKAWHIPWTVVDVAGPITNTLACTEFATIFRSWRITVAKGFLHTCE